MKEVKNNPSKIAQKLLYRVIRVENKLAALGDLEEEYREIADEDGIRKANRWYWKHVYKSLLPFIVLNIYWRIAMIKSFIKITYRNMKRNKLFSIINIFGLSFGLACTILILLWVNDELNVDKFHEKDNRLYQVLINYVSPDGIQTDELTQGLMAKALVDEMPEIEYAVAVIPPTIFNSTNIISVGDTHLKARGQYVSEDFFNIFSYKILIGDTSKILSDKYSVILSDELAQKLFNSAENSIGKTIQWNQKRFTGTYIVAGVFKKPPVNSTAQFDILFNYELFLQKYPRLNRWQNTNPYTYVLLRDGTNLKEFNTKIEELIKTKLDWLNDPQYSQDYKQIPFLQKYSDKYLYGTYENGIQTGGRITYVQLFSLIALFLLVIACINFMNLSTAQSARRSKEVGIKKTLGVFRKSLIAQYISETMVMTFLSLFIAIVIVGLLLPLFNQVSGKDISLVLNGKIILSILGITLFTGLISGSYPALYLSGFNTVQVLKGKLNLSIGDTWLRKGLVIFQFTISTLLIISVLVVYKQMDLIQNKNLGYERNNIITFPMGLRVTNNSGKNDKQMISNSIEDFLQRLKKIPGVINASNFGNDITNCDGRTDDVDWKAKMEDISFACIAVGYDFIETHGIKMKEGRTFSNKFSLDKVNIIINETAQEQMGLTEPVGNSVKYWGKEGQIIGVTQNFNFKSLYKDVEPLFFYLSLTHGSSNIAVKIESGIERETLDRLEKFYKEYNHGLPFEFKFLDEKYHALYESENRVALLSRYFATIAILISCLGLFGLAGFTAERRKKEIGIRKVLGSSEFGIVYLLSSDFTKNVIVAIAIAIPASYIIMKTWLDSFAYHIDLEIWYFLSATLITLFVAWLTVGLQTIKAALANPVESLKYE